MYEKPMYDKQTTYAGNSNQYVPVVNQIDDKTLLDKLKKGIASGLVGLVLLTSTPALTSKGYAEEKKDNQEQVAAIVPEDNLLDLGIQPYNPIKPEEKKELYWYQELGEKIKKHPYITALILGGIGYAVSNNNDNDSPTQTAAGTPNTTSGPTGPRTGGD